jgi:hypothetical protein
MALQSGLRTLTLKIIKQKEFLLPLGLASIPVTNATSITREVLFLKSKYELFKARLISVPVIVHVIGS